MIRRSFLYVYMSQKKDDAAQLGPNEYDVDLTELNASIHAEGQTAPDTLPQIEEEVSLTRRLINKTLSFLGLDKASDDVLENPGRRKIDTLLGSAAVLGMAYAIGGDALSSPDKKTEEMVDPQIEHKLEAEARKIAEKVNHEPHLNEQQKILRVIDYAGAAVFSWGVSDLLRSKHIHTGHYGALSALLAAKYGFSDEHGRTHLKEEMKANAKAFGIIGGTMAMAEGMNLDVQRAYEKVKDKKAPLHERIALATMSASAMSPLATTVGSAGIVKNMTNEIAGGDKSMMAVFESHVSNLSGYILIGDPPFMAICEKYGFQEGVKWQFQTMLPMGLYSLFSSTFKLNYLALQKDAEFTGATSKDLLKEAYRLTLSGLENNIGFLAKMMSDSLKNFTKSFFGVDKKFPQFETGIEFTIGKALRERFTKLAQLPFDENGLKHQGMGVETVSAEQEVFNLIAEFQEAGTPVASSESPSFFRSVSQEFSSFDSVEPKENSSDMSSLKSDDFWKMMNPKNIAQRTFDMNRMKKSAGHNLADVANVFPFQAGCVPFLVTVFKDGVEALDKMGMSQKKKELVMFFMIMAFSMIADNYVACKIGLELFPDKPHIALMASIQGGSLSAIGNMANVAQFSLDDYSLKDSFSKLGWHFDTTAMSLAWTQAIDGLTAMGIYHAPKPLGSSVQKNDSSSHHAESSLPSHPSTKKISRRFWKKGDDEVQA